MRITIDVDAEPGSATITPAVAGSAVPASPAAAAALDAGPAPALAAPGARSAAAFNGGSPSVPGMDHPLVRPAAAEPPRYASSALDGGPAPDFGPVTGGAASGPPRTGRSRGRRRGGAA